MNDLRRAPKWGHRLLLLACLLPSVMALHITAQAGGTSPPRAISLNVASDTAPLIQASDLTYSGAFRLPQGTTDKDSFEYGGTALAYHAAHESLLVVGHDWHQRIAEISIPRIVNGARLNDLATAMVRQPLVDALEGQIRRIGDGTAKIGGLLVWGHELIASAYLYYDGDGSQRLSHFRSSLDLARTGDLQGPYQVGTSGAGFVSGFMTPIPAEWQVALGGPALTGQCCLSIISRTSLGPAASVFAPAEIGTKNPVPATQVVGYPMAQPTLGACEAQSRLFNCTTEMAGVIFPAGTRSVLFFGRQGLGQYCYGEGGATGGECLDPGSTYKGPHAYPYAYQVWAYDALDLVAVKNGRKKPWAIQPYQTWNFELPFQHPSRRLGGVAYDPATKRLFLSALFGDGGQPVLHVFSLAARNHEGTSRLGGSQR